MLVNGHAEILVVASDKTASISFKLNQSNNNKSQLFYHQKLREPLSIFTDYKTTGNSKNKHFEFILAFDYILVIMMMTKNVYFRSYRCFVFFYHQYQLSLLKSDHIS